MINPRIFLLAVFYILSSMAIAAEKTITLIIPEGYVGDIYVVSEPINGDTVVNGKIYIEGNGIAYIKGFSDMAKLAPANFTGVTPSGRKIPNSCTRRRTKESDRLLWPIQEVAGRALYFVYGTFSEKTGLDNAKLRKWKQIIIEMDAAIAKHGEEKKTKLP